MKALKKLFIFSFILSINTINVFAENNIGKAARGIFSNEYIFTILLVLALAGVVLEFLTPGFGLGGAISLVSFGLFFWGNLLMNNTNWYSVLIFVIGILLLGIETLIPGFGIAGISGICAMIAAIVMAMSDIYFAFLSLLIAIIISAMIGTYLFKQGRDSELINKMRLFTSTTTESGFVSNDSSDVQIGQKLFTVTPLRPTGFANLSDEKIEVISNKGYVAKGVEVVVVRISGSNVYVEEVK
ncbi:NfeD family protein [Peptoniphilus sp.]|jgi:membrane-bound serine protease (ClpP class)|uniref:NfeD family protein n=1 Tax=Peptoniphilus sp. TaxID=1971214 RepID=UPI003D8E54C2